MDSDPVLQSNSRWIKGRQLCLERSQPGGECPRPSAGPGACFLRGTQGPRAVPGAQGSPCSFQGNLWDSAQEARSQAGAVAGRAWAHV